MFNKKRKRFLSVLMAFCMILGMLPMQSLITYAGTTPEETTPLASVWREGRLGIATGGTTSVSSTDGSVSITGAGLRLSKTTYDPATATTQDNMYYSYVKSEGATVITAKLSGTNSTDAVTTESRMTGIAVRGDGESTYAPYFAVYYDYSNSQFRYAYRNGNSSSSAYKSGASAIAGYTPVGTFKDDVFVKIVLTPNSDGSTGCAVYLSTTGEFAATANKSQTVLAFTPATSGLFGTQGTSLTASNLVIEKPAVQAVAAVPATDTTPAVAEVKAVQGKYYYNSAIGELKPTYAGDATDLTAKVYGDVVSIDQKGTTGIGTAGASYVLFPVTSAFYTMSVDVNISAYNSLTSSCGVFAGLFTSANTVANGQGGSTLALRYSGTGPQARGIYTKGSPTVAYGAGGMAATTYAYNTTYNLSITNKTSTMDYTISGESIPTPVSSTCGWSNTKNFITGSDGVNVTINQPLYYGICFAGVQSTYKNLKLINSNNYIIYDMNDYYEVASQPPVAGAITSATVNADRSAIDLSWSETTAAVGKGVYEVAYSTDGGTTYTVAGQTAAKKYSFNTNLSTGTYKFKVYGVYKTNVSPAQYSGDVAYVKPLPKVTVTATDNSGKVDLTWTASEGALSYDIYRADSYTKVSSATLISNVTTTSYTDSNVTDGPYYYYVIAKDATNTSNPSDMSVILVGGIYTGAVSKQFTDTIKLEGTLVYEDKAATITFADTNDTVFTNSNIVSGSVNQAGTIYAVTDSTIQSRTVAANEQFSFTFNLSEGRNAIDYFFVDANKNITSKGDYFIYLTSYDILVDGAYTGTDGALTNGVPTYKTIAAAIASVPTSNDKEKVIFIKNGQYNERLDISTPFISLVGEDSVRTRIYKSVAVADNTATSMLNRNCIAVQAAATGFTAENLTIENSYPYKNGSSEQADALMLNADQAYLANVRLLSFQDTLLTYNQDAKQIFLRCYITGNVDFIYGTSTVLFEDCDIVGRYTQYKADGCFLAPQTMKTSPYGYVFLGCRFTTEAGIAESAYRLARTYGEASAATFIGCYLGNGIKHGTGVSCYDVMNYPLSTARYYEYGSYGPAAQVMLARQLISFDEAQAAFLYVLGLQAADYTALNKAIADAEAISATNYTTDSYAALTKALTDAKAIEPGLFSDSQATIDAAAKVLTDAISALVLKDADYTALNTAITKAEALTASKYTTDSFAAVTKALTDAKAVATGLKIDNQATIDTATKALTDAIAGLVKLNGANYTVLNAAIASAESIQSTTYTTTSFAALTKAIADAKAVVAKDYTVSDQSIVDAAVVTLNNAVTGLVKLGANYTALNSAITNAKAIQSTTYTTTSFAALTTAIADAQAVVAKAYNIDSQSIVDAAVVTLNNAVTGLVKLGANYTALNSAITNAKAIQSTTYTTTSFSALTTAIADAQAVVAKAYNIDSQSIVDAAVVTLNNAVTGLVKLGANYTALNTAISVAESIQSTAYTTASFSALTTAIADAKAVVAKAYNIDSQSIVDAAVVTLNNAVSALVFKDADYTALNNAITTAQALTASTYTTDSFAVVTKALADAKAIATGLKADKQDTIDAATTALNNAIAALKIYIVATGNTDVTLSAPSGIITNGSKMEVVALTTGDAYTNAAAVVKTNSEVQQFAIFEINLKNSAGLEVHQLEGKVSISLPVPAGLDTTKTISVFRVESDGTLTKLDTKVENGKCIFETDHFSTYVIAEVAATSTSGSGTTTTDTSASTTTTTTDSSAKTGDSTPITMYMMIMGISAGTVLYVSRKRRVRKAN